MEDLRQAPRGLLRTLQYRLRMLRPMSVGTAVVALSISAGLVHLLQAPAHLRSGWIQGAFFLLVGLLQVALPGAKGTRSAVGLLLLNAAVLLIWAVSRTVGLPLIDTSGPVDIGPPDLFVSLMELATIALLVRSTMVRSRSRVVSGGIRKISCVSALCLISFVIATPNGVACGHETTHPNADSRTDQSDSGPCGELSR